MGVGMSADIELLSILLLKAREGAVASIKPVLQEHELTEQQWRVIRELHKNGDMNAQRLAEESGILSPSLSRILARFTDDGVVVRKTDKQDQRAQSIRLSAKGKRLHDRIHPKVASKYKSVEAHLGGDTIIKLQSLLQSVSSSLPNI